MYDETNPYGNLTIDQIDFLNWMCDESPTSRPMDDAELEQCYQQRLADDARNDAASVAEPAKPEPVVVPETRYIVSVGMKGKRFAAVVECPDGRKVKAGVHKFEADAWGAAERLARELREDDVAVA